MATPMDEENLRYNLRMFSHKLNEVMEEYLGKKYKLDKGVDKAQLFRIAKLGRELIELDFSTLDLNEFKLKLNHFFEEAKKINPNRKLEKHPADLVMDMTRLYLTLPKETSTLRNTKFSTYSLAAFDIARKVQEAGKVNEVIALYLNIPEKQLKEFVSHAQQLTRELGLLERRYARLNDRAIQKYIQLYFDMCINMEKITRFLLAINRIVAGGRTTYEELDLRGPTFGNMIKELRTFPHFRDLVEPIEPAIKNAKSHGRIIPKPSSRSITFNDRNSTITLTYEEFIQKCRETCAAMIVSAQVGGAVVLPELEKLRDFLKS